MSDDTRHVHGNNEGIVYGINGQGMENEGEHVRFMH